MDNIGNHILKANHRKPFWKLALPKWVLASIAAPFCSISARILQLCPKVKSHVNSTTYTFRKKNILTCNDFKKLNVTIQ